MRSGQRCRVRHAICPQAVRGVPASPQFSRLRRHWHRLGQRPPHCAAPWRSRLGRRRRRRWRHLLLLTSQHRRALLITELKRIVLAEDDENDVELTVSALQENHVANEIVVVRDGAEALDYLYKRNGYASRSGSNPALLLLDLKMPKVDGLEVLRQVKSDPAMRSIPVVVLTSSREEQDLLRSYDLGVNAYVVKPVDFNEFIGAVKLLGGFWAVLNEQPPQK